jgi:two-component system phosphate regulon sensor histidine kinase PhoR
VPFEELALLLPQERGLEVVASHGAQILPRDWTPSPDLERLAPGGPVPAPPMLLPLPRGFHALVAGYGQRGVLLLARRRSFRADERAALGLVLAQLSSTLEQVRLLDEIDRERERLAVLLASSGEGIFVVDGDGCVARVNDALRGLTGLSDEQAVGRPIEAILSYRDRSEVPLAALLSQVGPGAPLMTEGLLTGRDGREHDVLLSFAAIALAGDHTGGIGIVRDVTAMREAQRERDDFINVMTHDLRQPLAGILGYAQLLERGLKSDGGSERLTRYATGVREGGDRMLRMINNLLELARIESGRVQIEAAPLALEAVVEEAIRSFEPEAMQKSLTIALDCPAALPTVETSEPLVREIVANLIGNAVKYTPDGGAVTVALRAGDAGITIAITDTGIGIPAEALPRLFTRFFRTGQAEVRQIRGSGLGLALTKMMVERIGGTISVESQLGRGTTFTVCLPTAMPTADPP